MSKNSGADWAPQRKVISIPVVGSLSSIMVYFLNTFNVLPEPMPAEVGIAIVTAIATGVAYMVPNLNLPEVRK